MTTKKMPQMTTVIVSVSSIWFQLDASGVSHHGLTSWNSTEPMMMMNSATAMAIRGFLAVARSARELPVCSAPFQPGVREYHRQAEHEMSDEGRPAAQVGDPREE